MMAKAVMVQGTASSVGKSVITAALCRLFAREGLRVAPFKSQNMSNNSFVTRDGHEIARAQAEQAHAAGIEPTVDMNPVLLKPLADGRMQVVLHGKPVCIMRSRDYELEKLDLAVEIQGSLERLMSSHDVVVIEGAGSPAEVNLYDRDLANMLIARIARAPVILVGDIDRGGAFASLVGTLELLHPEDRTRVQALLINKFRGDKDQLESGLRFLTARTGVPVLGVVPFDPDIRIREEDMVGEAKHRPRGAKKAKGLRVYAIHFPSISNHTDVEPLRQEPDVELVFLDKVPQDLPDVLILPGSRSTMADLEFVRRSGFDAYVARCAQAGVQVIGLCGGYQMLCEYIEDPGLVEGPVSAMQGLALIGGTTVFSSCKQTTRVHATHLASGVEVEGYEIHMGFTRHDLLREPVFRIAPSLGFPEERLDGAVTRGGQIWGTYLHGIFEVPEFRAAVLAPAREKHGLKVPAAGSVLPDPYEHVADLLAANIDLGLLHELVGVQAPAHAV